MSSDLPRWRVIGTDTESDSGVAPVCGICPAESRDVYSDTIPDHYCPGPHLECWSPYAARAVVAVLNEYGVEVCD